MRGSRECRVRAAPAVSCAICTKKSAHEHTGTVGTLRHSLRNGFTAYGALSPETNSSCLRRWRISGWSNPVGSTSPPLNLAPATGVGTTRFCRTHQRRSSCAASARSRKTALRSHHTLDAAASTAHWLLRSFLQSYRRTHGSHQAGFAGRDRTRTTSIANVRTAKNSQTQKSSLPR